MKLRRFLITMLLITPLLLAVGLMQEISPATMAAIATVISVLVGIVGPKPVKTILGWITAVTGLVIEGQGAVLFVYVLSFVVGAVGLLVSKQLLGIEFVWENALAIAGLLFAAATFSYHRLKDLGKV